MKPMKNLPLTRGVKGLSVAAVLAIAMAPATGFATAIGVSWSGDVYTIDETTGVGSFLGASGFSELNSAAADSVGTVFSSTDLELVTIDSTSGLGTGVVSYSAPFSNGIRGLAFADDDTLYALADTGPLGSLGPDSLYTVDIGTGNFTLVGSTGLTDVQGLAFSASGDLFAWDITSGLMSLDLTTGFATDVGAAAGISGIQALEFGADGTLFGGRDELYSIDTATGAWSLIGGGGYSDVRGLAIASAAVPEPGAFALMGVGLVSIAAAKRWRYRRTS